jgi:hypothetical protein
MGYFSASLNTNPLMIELSIITFTFLEITFYDSSLLVYPVTSYSFFDSVTVEK